MRRIKQAVALIAAIVLAGTACGGGDDASSGKVTLDFWVFEEGGIGSFLSTLEDQYEEENPNVDLKFTPYPEDNYGVKLDTAIAAGKTPDLILVFGLDYMREGIVMPLDDMIKAHDIDLSTYTPAIVTEGDEFSCAYQGHIYCLGSYAGSVQLLYNKDMFDEAGIPYPEAYPPMTPEEFVDIACQLSDPDNGVWGAAASDPLAYIPWEMFFSPDGRTVDGYFNGPETVAQVENLARAYEDDCVPSSNVLDPWEQGRDFFARGELGMVITDFQDLDKVDAAGINWGSTASPTPAGWDPYFFVWTDSVGVMSDSDNPDEAKDFIAFLTTQGQQIRYETSGDIPLDTKVAEQVNWANGVPGREEGLEVLKHSRPAIFIPNRWDVIAPYYDAWGYILSGEKSVQDALDDAAPDIQENLDKAWDNWEEQG